MFLNNKKGQALVETALTLPILLLVLMGIIEFGIIFNSYLIITNASREGARYAAIHDTDNQIQGVVDNLTQTLDRNKLKLTITPISSNRISGNSVTVKIDYDVSIIMPFINVIIPNPFRISSQTTMRVE